MTLDDIYEYARKLCRSCDVIHCITQRPYRVILLCTGCARVDSIRFTGASRSSYEKYPYHMGFCPYGKKTYIETTARCLSCSDILNQEIRPTMMSYLEEDAEACQQLHSRLSQSYKKL